MTVMSPQSRTASAASSSSCWFLTAMDDTNAPTDDVIDHKRNVNNEIQVFWHSNNLNNRT